MNGIATQGTPMEQQLGSKHQSTAQADLWTDNGAATPTSFPRGILTDCLMPEASRGWGERKGGRDAWASAHT